MLCLRQFLQAGLCSSHYSKINMMINSHSECVSYLDSPLLTLDAAQSALRVRSSRSHSFALSVISQSRLSVEGIVTHTAPGWVCHKSRYCRTIILNVSQHGMMIDLGESLRHDRRNHVALVRMRLVYPNCLSPLSPVSVFLSVVSR
jgi:hypothetical protein